MGQVKNILGFHSPAKEGPGADADTWAPNLMRMFAGGIADATPALATAATQAMAAVKGALTGGVSSGLSLSRLPTTSGGALSAAVASVETRGANSSLLGEPGAESGAARSQAAHGGAAGGGDINIYGLTVQVIADADEREPYQAGVAFGNGFAAGFQQARTQRGI